MKYDNNFINFGHEMQKNEDDTIGKSLNYIKLFMVNVTPIHQEIE